MVIRFRPSANTPSSVTSRDLYRASADFRVLLDSISIRMVPKLDSAPDSISQLRRVSKKVAKFSLQESIGFRTAHAGGGYDQ
jgi:predicted ATP-dependent serine protease